VARIIPGSPKAKMRRFVANFIYVSYRELFTPAIRTLTEDGWEWRDSRDTYWAFRWFLDYREKAWDWPLPFDACCEVLDLDAELIFRTVRAVAESREAFLSKAPQDGRSTCPVRALRREFLNRHLPKNLLADEGDILTEVLDDGDDYDADCG